MIVRAVELLSVGQRAGVIYRDRLARLGTRPITLKQISILKP